MKLPFIPRGDREKAEMLNNFALKLPLYAALLGVTPAEVTSAANDAAMFKYTMDVQEVFKTHKQNVSNYKNVLRDGPDSAPSAFPVVPPLPPEPALVNDGIFTRISNLAVRMKRHPVYKESMGEGMGIVGDEQTIDITNMKPVLNSRLDSGRPLIIWKKGPAADVLDIYVDRKDGLGFVFLATDTQPDYLDTFPVPAGVTTAVWDYKAIYRIGDDTVGQFSEPIQVTVTRKTGY